MARGDTTVEVRQLARARGVSERTVWRWLARMRQEGDTELELLQSRCKHCRRPLPHGSTIRKDYCDVACRVAAHRARKREPAACPPASP